MATPPIKPNMLTAHEIEALRKDMKEPSRRNARCPLKGATTRPGLYKGYACKKSFTVRMGTIFESSHLPLLLWLQVIHLFCCSKKGTPRPPRPQRTTSVA
jgi:hypothetical protein